jgi:aryl-phospho-beta-D-glucosidase BglC (GH1 family)
MQRVHQVVDYVISQGMYCILNIHHDTGSANTAWLVADEQAYASQRERFKALWTQIAEEFRDYDEHLLFEGYNEMLDVKDSWCFASFASEGGYDAKIANSAYNAINGYAQTFVDAVRATGGNNEVRNLIVSTYGACSGFGTWNNHLQDPLKQMKLPDDSAEDHLVFEIHSYPDISNLDNAKKELRTAIGNIKSNLEAKGAPVIFGEWGVSSSTAYSDNRASLLSFARYFVEQSKAAGIGTFYWMGLSDGKHRSVPEFNQADLVDAIVKGYYGDGGYEGYVGIRDAKCGVKAEGIYDLCGRRMNTDESSLHKGIYIIGGKKVAVK